jgi:uncharacterized lipoprotein YddW (UPF0748 family)
MNKTGRIFVALMILTFVFTGTQYQIKADNKPNRAEIRALWVDAFRDGIKTPSQIDQLLQDAVSGNINTLIVQVRRRGDSFYNKSIEPRTEDPDLLPGFDALQYLIEQAHAKNIEVHAWLNTLVAWNSVKPPKDPNHVWNQHGPSTTGKDNWVSYYRTYDKNKKTWSDRLQSSYFLDPGHPDVIDYTAAIYLNVVRNYDVDGIHLDYSRYAGLGWGYNATSVARFNQRYGTEGMPDPDDPRWAEWRREQTANLVRKIYLEAIAIKPQIKVSSAVVTWGSGPLTDEDWEKSRACQEVFQDWRSWLEEGIIDLVIPMNYFSEWRSSHQKYYNQWIEWEKDHQYNRQIVIGPGIYMNYIEDSLEQIRRAQAPSQQGNYAAGVCLFSYGASNIYSCSDFKTPAASRGFPRQPHRYVPETNYKLIDALARPNYIYDPVLERYTHTTPVFSDWVDVPAMPWKVTPQTGYLMGTINGNNKVYDYTKVTVERVGLLATRRKNQDTDELGFFKEVYTNGNGWFGLAEVPTGIYRVSINEPEFEGKKVYYIVIKPGQVSEVWFENKKSGDV